MVVTKMFICIIVYFITIPLVYAEQDSMIDDFLNKTMSAIEKSQYEEAMSYLDKILELDSENHAALSNKGAVLIELGQHQEALKYLDQALLIKPDHVQNLSNKAISLSNLGKLSEALSLLFDAFSIDPANSDTVKNIEILLEYAPWERKQGFATIELRNNSGDLVGYTQSERVNVKIPFGIKFMERFSDWKDDIIKGERVETISYSQVFIIKGNEMYSRTDVSLAGGLLSQIEELTTFKVIEIAHDSFLVKAGDVVNATITLIRPIS